MAIEKYTTKAIVIEGYDQSENDKAFKIFTREFGMIICHAKSIRKLESKLRAHILPRGMSTLTLVKGKEVWRLVGADVEECSSSRIHEVTAILSRFIRGEGAHKALFDRITSLLSHKGIYDISITRLLLYYIMLVELGYADAKVIGARDIKEYIHFSIDELYTHILLTKPQVTSHVKEVLKEMQL